MSKVTLLQGDCLDKLKELQDNSIDSVVTDPPYEIGFMGKGWDDSGIANNPELWKEVLRVLKPGGHLLSFSHSRTYHRQAVAVEDAGFEIRDQIMWVYGSGFPKSHNLIKQIEKENICQFIKNAKTNNAITQLKHFQVELNEGKIDSVLTNVVMYQEEGVENRTVIGVVVDSSPTDMSIFATKEDIEQNTILLLNNLLEENLKKGKKFITLTELKQIIDLKIFNLLPNQNMLKSIETLHGTALKPSHEPIVMARKPFKGSVANNVLEWGTGGINIDASRIGNEPIQVNVDYKSEKQSDMGWGTKKAITEIKEQGRFPANIIFDEEAGKILDEQSGVTKSSKRGAHNNKKTEHTNTYTPPQAMYSDENTYGDLGGASRFFYCPKASKKDRNEGVEHLEVKRPDTRTDTGMGSFTQKGVQPQHNSHPTVKPTDLMAYLIRMVTPKGGTVLDPFMGSGSTGKASVREGFNFIGIEREDEYMEIAKSRIEHEQGKHKHRQFFNE